MNPPWLTGGAWMHPENLLPKFAEHFQLQPVGAKLKMLDLGGGGGTVGGGYWHGRGVDLTVVDAWKPKTPRSDCHFVLMDALEFLAGQSHWSWDFVMSCEMIEHLEKERGFELLEEIKRVTRQLAIVSSPNGYTFQDPAASPNEPWADNPYQKHVCGWSCHDYFQAGFNVYGNGGDPAREYAAGQLIAYWHRNTGAPVEI